MYIKIYFNDKPLFLCDAIDDVIQPYVHHDDSIFMDELNVHSIKTIIHEMQQPQVHAGVFYHPDLADLKKAFLKRFSVIVAAGGLIKNEKKEILMIFRRGRWDLPKGKLDKGENMEDCAIREVQEETGLKNVVLKSPLTTTHHVYHEGTKHIFKESHWFTMTVAGKQQLTPQTEEDITDIKWIEQDLLDSYLQKTFPLINDVIDAAIKQKFILS